MEPEASELPKGLVLFGGGHVHIRHRGSTPLDNVGSNNPPPLGAGRPRRHTSDQGLAMIPNCHIPARATTTSRARLRRNTILFALGPDHALTVLFLGTHASRTSQWVTHLGMLWPTGPFPVGHSHEQNFPVGHPSGELCRPMPCITTSGPVATILYLGQSLIICQHSHLLNDLLWFFEL